MANVTVSVIMPVYGVEDYVGGAIESIQAQTLTDWELFCVDDGSKDRSGEVCDSYAAKDPRIHVIHKENGGAPSARNVAIDKAEGKYLYFCDADDWAEKTMLEDMVSIAEENGSQLVVAGFYIDTYYSDTEKFTQCQEVPSRVFATQREFREHAHELFDQNLLYTPWNKLFLASYIKDNKLYFPQTFWDDFPFNLSVVRDLRLVFFEVETHALEALVDGVIVDDLAHRVDIGLRFQVILDLIDRPFHTEAEAGMVGEDHLYISSLSHNSWTFFQMISAAAFSSFFFREPGVKPRSSYGIGSPKRTMHFGCFFSRSASRWTDAGTTGTFASRAIMAKPLAVESSSGRLR